MTYVYAQITQTARSLLRIACVAALAGAFTALQLPVVHATDLEPPPIPPNLEVPTGHTAFRLGHAIGTQNYICLSIGAAWTFVGPQATLFNDYDWQLITHFLSPNPDEGGMARATWQHSRDTSAVWAVAIASSTDPDFVDPEAIPWLLLQVVGAEPGPTHGERLARTTYIQRLNTSGGSAPPDGCPEVGQRRFVPYTADYIFYKASEDEGDDRTR
jgi:hypothetical protein